MKTTVEIDDNKWEIIRKLDSTLETEEEIIDSAFEKLIGFLRRQRLIETFGSGWDGDLDEMRSYDVPLT